MDPIYCLGKTRGEGPGVGPKSVPQEVPSLPRRFPPGGEVLWPFEGTWRVASSGRGIGHTFLPAE